MTHRSRLQICAIGALVAAIGCASDDGASNDSNGGAASSTLIKNIDVESYDALCVRLQKSADLSVLDECTSEPTSAECHACADGLLGEAEVCKDRIGMVGTYPAKCDWSVGKLNQCFDQREQLQKTLSCEKPGRKQSTDAENCLYQFRKLCVPDSI